MPLTDVKVRNAKPAEKPYKLSDAGGLHLMVTPAGHRSWRLRYQRDGKERLVVLGSYPEMSLREAREARDDHRHKLRHGGERTVNAEPEPVESFGSVIGRWLEQQRPLWRPSNYTQIEYWLRPVMAGLGSDPIDRVTAPRLLAELRRVAERSADIAHRVRGHLDRVFAMAIGEGLVTENPAAMIVKAMPPAQRNGQRKAVVGLEDARIVLRLLEDASAILQTRLAMRMLAITAVRPGEICGMAWNEVHGDVWAIPKERMKMNREHLVPLTRQAKEILAVARSIPGRRDYVFPSPYSNAPMATRTLAMMMWRTGLNRKHVPHGWRATFSTLMNERYPDDRMVIDLMLAHAPARAKGQVEAAYNRADYWTRRCELAQIWADLLLDGFRPPAALADLSNRGLGAGLQSSICNSQ